MEGKIYKNEIRLNNSRAVLKLLARTINGLQMGEIQESKARTLGYLSGIMLKAFETVDFDERLQALEEKLNKKVG